VELAEASGADRRGRERERERDLPLLSSVFQGRARGGCERQKGFSGRRGSAIDGSSLLLFSSLLLLFLGKVEELKKKG
jgi:hypothetical protein